MKSREKLLDELAADLQPVSSRAATMLPGWLWLVASMAWVVLLIHLMGPVRPGVLVQLQENPRFTLEIVLGLVAACVLAVAAFRSAVPGRLSRTVANMALGLSLLWVLAYVLGLVAPALEPSMLGKRDHCVLETPLYALLPLLALLYWQRQRFAVMPDRSAMFAGLAAGILPALYMQIACMYGPVHILAFHIGPALALALAAPLLLRFMPAP